MLKAVFSFLLIISLFLVGCSEISTFQTAENVDSELSFLTLPEGYQIEIFVDDLGPSSISRPGPNKGARLLEFKDNIIYVSVPGKGQVETITIDDDFNVLSRGVLVSGLNNPHGIAFHNDDIYIAEEHRVIKLPDEEIVTYPSGGHWTRTIKIINDELYVSVGSSCNACEEDSPWRAAITKCGLDGSNCEPFATGLRNTVGFIEYEGKIYGTDNGRDLIGNDIPPEEINVIEEGKDYGWPLCYGDQIHDTAYDDNVYIRNPCEDTVSPFVEMQAHSAPLGLDVYEGDLLVAYHGSWNRDPPTGYKVVRIDLETKQISDFVYGWLSPDEDVFGRPVDVKVVNNNILISDDVAGVIYRVFRT